MTGREKTSFAKNQIFRLRGEKKTKKIRTQSYRFLGKSGPGSKSSSRCVLGERLGKKNEGREHETSDNFSREHVRMRIQGGKTKKFLGFPKNARK